MKKILLSMMVLQMCAGNISYSNGVYTVSGQVERVGTNLFSIRITPSYLTVTDQVNGKLEDYTEKFRSFTNSLQTIECQLTPLYLKRDTIKHNLSLIDDLLRARPTDAQTLNAKRTERDGLLELLQTQARIDYLDRQFTGLLQQCSFPARLNIGYEVQAAFYPQDRLWVTTANININIPPRQQVSVSFGTQQPARVDVRDACTQGNRGLIGPYDNN